MIATLLTRLNDIYLWKSYTIGMIFIAIIVLFAILMYNKFGKPECET